LDRTSCTSSGSSSEGAMMCMGWMGD
jgi:hypothetical protein